MKYFLITIAITISSYSYSQTADYNNLTKKGVYTDYITKQGDTLSVGDTLIIGVSNSDIGFAFISQGGQRVANRLSGNKVVISKFKTYGNKNQGFKVYALFMGYGLYPCLIDYEIAIEKGEIKDTNAKLTKEEAINKLKEAKDLLELGVIDETEYNRLKNELTPLILNK